MTVDIATLGLRVDASQIREGDRALDDLEQQADRTEQSTTRLSRSTDILSRLYRDLAAAIAFIKMAELIKDSALLAARYNTLGITMTVVGKQAGYTAVQMEATAVALQKTGISMIESRQQAMQLVQAHIDLSQATKLARIAQDAAVIGNLNSSEAFATLVQGIQTGQTETLRTIGININLEQAYGAVAQQLGKNVKQLSQNEKTQAVVNAVMKAGGDIAGTYAAAMDTASKQLLSLKRYTEDLKTVQGEVFNEILTVAVMAYTAHLKDANGEVSAMAQNGDLKRWGQDLAQIFVSVANAIDNSITGIKMVGNFLGKQGVGADINKQFDARQSSAPKMATMGGALEQYRRIEAERAKALVDAEAFYEKQQIILAGGADRFQRAFDERQVAKADKESKAIKATEANEKQLQSIMVYYAGQREKGLITEKAYLAAVAQTMQAFTGDNHKYDDTTPTAKADASARKAIDTYNDLIRSIKEKTAASALDEQTQGNLTAGQQLAIKVMEDLRAGELKLTDVQKKKLAVDLESYLTQERITAARDADAKAQKDAEQRATRDIDAIWAQARAMEQQVELYGLSATAVLNLEAVRLQAAIAGAARLELSDLEISKLEQQLAAVQALAKATQALDTKNVLKKQGEEARSQAQKTADVWENALTTALMNGFSAGKGFAASARDTIVAMFQSMVLRPVVQAVGQAGASMASTALNGVANAAGNGAASILGNVGTAGGLYNAYTSSTLGQFMSGASGSAGAASQALGAPMTNAAQYGQMASNGLSGAGGAVPYLGMAGGALAAYGVGERIGGVGGAVAGGAAAYGTIAAGGALAGGMAGTGMAAGATAALAAIPVWGWIAIAAIAILGSMQDGPEKVTRLMFGSNNLAGAISINERGNEGKKDEYVAGVSSTGALGSFGVVSTFWMEAAQPMVESFVKTVTQTDDALAQFMNSTEKAAAVAAVNAQRLTSTSGIEGSDPNGQGGLDSVFRARVTAIMAAVDPALAKLLDGFVGTSQLLAAEATALLDYRKNLPAVSDVIFGATVTIQEMLALRTPTETMGAALTRITTAFTGTNAIAETLGFTVERVFGAVGLASLQARQRLIDLAGGVDVLAAGAGYFAANFLSEADRLKPIVEALTKRMGDLGYAGAVTAAGYKAAVMGLVESGAVATEAGAKTYIELLKLAPGFTAVANAAKPVAPAIEEVVDALEQMRNAADSLLGDVDGQLTVAERVIEREKAAKQRAHEIAMRAIEAQITAASAGVEKTRALANALGATLDGMRAPGGAAGDRKAAQAQIAAALAISRAGGPLPSADALRGALATVSQNSADLFATYEDYQRDFYTTAGDISGLNEASNAALTVQERTLAALEAQKILMEKAYADDIAGLDAQLEFARQQVELLKGMDVSLLSIAQAMAALSSSVLAAQKNPILAATAGITGAYQSALGRAPDAAGLQFWQGQAAAGGSIQDIVSAIGNSPEAKVQALYKSTLGRTADAGGLNFWMQQMQSGASEQQIRAAMTQSDEYQSMPRFGAGGNHAGGWRLVGENGAEAEYTGPSSIVSASATRGMLDQSGVEAEVRELGEMLFPLLYNISKYASKTADATENLDRNGVETRTPAL